MTCSQKSESCGKRTVLQAVCWNDLDLDFLKAQPKFFRFILASVFLAGRS